MAKLTDKELKELEELQYKAANKGEGGVDEARLRELSARLQEERFGGAAADAGVIGDENKDGTPDKDDDKSGGVSATPTHTVTGEAPGHDSRAKGVTTTKNISK